jgi:hypothetical protein
MKLIRILFLTAAIPFCAHATDIILKDGRIFKEATITSQASQTVTIKYVDGLCSVSKELLPPELQAQYPMRGDATRESPKADTKVREQNKAVIPANRAAARKEAAREYAVVENDVFRHAKDYFLHDYYRGSNSTMKFDCSISLIAVRPVEGQTGRWSVEGRAYMKYFSNPGGPFTWQTLDFEANYCKQGSKTDFEVKLL